MKKIALLLVACLVFLGTSAQSPNAYKIFRSSSEPISFNEMVNELALTDIALFGELHDNPIAHWLQIELCHRLNDKEKALVLGAEMFETDNQLILDEYLTGLISQRRFEGEARLWNNYKTDYKPLVEFARENSIPFIATNIPRRYASMVASGGFEALDSLTAEAKKYIAPLPVEYNPALPGYQDMLSMMGMPGKASSKSENFPKAQAIKDATMAWSIANNYEEGKLFIHFHGTYHSNNYEGIVWYLNRYKPNVVQKTIATVLQATTNELSEDNKNLADYIIVVPERMTRTY
ncbi:MAG TPA: ChaN family lipoprotein [Perlabentimonas sp.]|nr:ChaN family lipoprotein [Perlabentimonas sp.]